MDAKTNSNFEIKWFINVGDVVRIKKYDFHQTSGEDKFEYVYGTVINIFKHEETLLFPTAEILFFKTNRRLICYPGQFEVISYDK